MERILFSLMSLKTAGGTLRTSVGHSPVLREHKKPGVLKYTFPIVLYS